jgi:hypothetical protein
MRRATLSEIHEQSWFPTSLRDHVTDTLQFIFDAIKIYRPVAPRLDAALRASATNRIVDLCSGAGGPWKWLLPSISNHDSPPVRVILTDRFPNLAAFRRLREKSAGAIDFSSDPVDAQAIPSQLCGFRTMFSTLHHFAPDEIVAILRGAVEQGQGIGFFEAARRRPRTIFYACFMPLAALVGVPFMRPFRFTRLLWTYLLPVIPFVLLFDGVLSCLRAYTPEELRALASRARAENYTWDIADSGPVTYLLALPSSRGTASHRPSSCLP